MRQASLQCTRTRGEVDEVVCHDLLEPRAVVVLDVVVHLGAPGHGTVGAGQRKQGGTGQREGAAGQASGGGRSSKTIEMMQPLSNPPSMLISSEASKFAPPPRGRVLVGV